MIISADGISGSGAPPRVLDPSNNGITTVPATVRGLALPGELHPCHNKLVSVDGAIVAPGGTLRKGDAGAAALFGSGAALHKLRLSFNGINTSNGRCRGYSSSCFGACSGCSHAAY